MREWAVWSGKAIGVNRRTFKTRTGQIITSPAYQKFKKELVISWMIWADGNHQTFPLIGPVALEVEQISGYDFDALLKPIADAAEEAKIVENDRQIVLMRLIRMHRPGRGPTVLRMFLYSTEKVELNVN